MKPTMMNILISLSITSCACVALAQPSAQPAFPSAAAASESLFQAVRDNNEGSIASILGGPTDLTTSGDPAQDKVDRELFVRKYQEMHRLRREADGSVMLYMGAENWPFPIPLMNKNGSWRFDPEAGRKEVLFRRIGENELIAIANCLEFVAADSNNAGTTDLAPTSLVAKAAGGSGSSDPIHGYYFRLVGNAPHGFALIAYPAEYRSSGVMTFLVTKKGVVYEKDLGVGTSALASKMTASQKDATWRAVDK